MGEQLSRRSFIGGALAAGAGLVSAGALSACSGSAAAAQGPGVPAQWDKEAEFVVLGSGCAGMYAAIEAADWGLSVLMLEKQPEETAGGDSRCNAAYFPKASVDANLTMGINSFGEASEDWAYEIEDEGMAAIDWLIDHGCEWIDQPYGFMKGYGPSVYTALRDAMYEAGVEVLYETPAKELIQNASGEVIGVKAEANGELINVKAKKGVLIATGSYTCNKQMISDFHLPGLDLYSIGSPFLTGDGLIMAGNIGAKLSKLSKGLEFMTLVSKKASEEIGTGIFCNAPVTATMIYVNGHGKRFMDEYTSLTHSKSTLPLFAFSGSMVECRSATAHYDNEVIYEIVDQAAFDSGSLGNAGSSCSWAMFFDADNYGYVWSYDNQEELKKGWIVKADTIEALAQTIGLNPQVLAETVQTYNDGCAAGIDEFGRNASNLAPLGEGPYYAIEVAPSIIYTIGGLTTDDWGRTLNWNNEPIPRLYSAGNVGNSSIYLQPLAVNGSMAQGIIAARDVIELDSWDERD